MNSTVKRIINSFFLFCVIVFASTDLSAEKKKPLTHITMGEFQFPIVARADDVVIFRLKDTFVQTKAFSRKEGDSKYEGCQIFEAQSKALMEPLAALALYEECLESNSDDFQIYRAIGVLSLAIRDKEKSRRHFERVVELVPEDGVAHEQYADILYILDFPQEAKKHYDQALALNRREKRRLTGKVKTIEELGQADKVEAHLLKTNGFIIENGFIAGFSYWGKIANRAIRGVDDPLYITESAEGKTAIVFMDEVYQHSRLLPEWQLFLSNQKQIYQEGKEQKERKVRDVEKRLKKSSSHNRVLLEQELHDLKKDLMAYIITSESIHILAKSEVLKEVDKRLRSAAEAVAEKKGFGMVLKAKQWVTGINATQWIIDEMKVQDTGEPWDFKKMFEETKRKINIPEDIDMEEFYSKEPRRAEAKKGDKGPAAKTGTSSNSEGRLSSAESGFVDQGLAQSIKNKLFDWEPAGRRNVFSVNEDQIVWFARLSDKEKYKNSRPYKKKEYKIMWIDPDGGVHSDAQIKKHEVLTDLLESTLKLSQIVAPPKGRWQIRVWRNDELVEERTFRLI